MSFKNINFKVKFKSPFFYTYHKNVIRKNKIIKVLYEQGPNYNIVCKDKANYDNRCPKMHLRGQRESLFLTKLHDHSMGQTVRVLPFLSDGLHDISLFCQVFI